MEPFLPRERSVGHPVSEEATAASARVVHVTTAGGTDAELAADALWGAGAAAVEERPTAGGTLLVAGTAAGDEPAPLLAAVGGRWAAEVVAVDLDAALDAWRPHARAVVAGRLVVRPPWVAGGAAPTAPGAVEVVIDPGRAFGSGSHASTRLALAALDGLVAGGERVLDVGCGSGVLAVAALALGAAEAVGVDLAPAARAATAANARRNGVAERLRVAGATLDDVVGAPGNGTKGDTGDGRFDLVVANMLAPVLVELAPSIQRALAPGAALVLSGLLSDQRTRALAAYGDLAVVAEHAEDDWRALTLRR